MCGIAGIVHSDSSRPVLPGTIHEMCDSIVHRGPDDYGEYINGSIGFGMRRLSIIDLHTGKQPLSNENGTVWIVFNGEIYNYLQLRKELELKGHKFRTTSDTEVIVHLYEDLGEKCVERLRGMFAFAIWDTRDRKLVVARDRLGIKPLYYAEIPEGLLFASEIKALLIHPGLSRDLNPEAVAEYFTHLCVPGELSIYQSIRKLPPAHILIYRGEQVHLTRYWQVQPAPDDSQTENDWIEQLRVRLREAVETHMVSDVPIGAFLSGGLDSGTMVALMAQSSKESVRTFTVGFTTEVGQFDERVPAQAVAERYGTKHYECLLQANVSDLLPRIVLAFDEPFADSSAIPNWLVCQETARHVKVALSGLGGDEIFGGYPRYPGMKWGTIFRRVPRSLRYGIEGLLSSIPYNSHWPYFKDRATRFLCSLHLPPIEQYRQFVAAFSDIKGILHPDLYHSLSHTPSSYYDIIQSINTLNPVDLAMFTDLYLYLPNDLLTLTDRISMAHSLEVRVPYLDHELVEFASRIPSKYKVGYFQGKLAFRKSVTPLLPRKHFRRRKQGFSVPIAEWLRKDLRCMVLDSLESRIARQSPFLDIRAIHKLAEEHLTRRRNHEVRLWAILCFLEWERQYASVKPARLPSDLISKA